MNIKTITALIERTSVDGMRRTLSTINPNDSPYITEDKYIELGKMLDEWYDQLTREIEYDLLA